jgi:hypothetical protein
MREAAGVQPVRNSFFPSRRKLDDAVRDQFRNLVRQNREYSTAVHNADVSQVKFLNTPESFTNPELAAGGLAQLHSICDMDAAQEEKVQEIIGNLRHTIESTASSGAEREALIKGMDEGMAAPMAKRQALIASEKAWRQAVDDEYAFAARYSSSFRLIQGHLVIDDPALRQDFNTRVSFQESQRKQFLAMEKEFRQFQGQLLQKMGVNPGDLGVAK